MKVWVDGEENSFYIDEVSDRVVGMVVRKAVVGGKYKYIAVKNEVPKEGKLLGIFDDEEEAKREVEKIKV